MPVTLTDEQVETLRRERDQWQRDRAVAQASTDIWNDPNLGNDAKALWKRKYPDSEIQGYDTEQRMIARLDKEKAERDEEKKKAREREQDDDLAARRRALKEKRSYTDDDVQALETFMVERGISNHEDAADLMAARKPSPSEGTAEYDQHFWHHERSPQYKEIAQDPEGWGRNEIMTTLRQMKAKARS